MAKRRIFSWFTREEYDGFKRLLPKDNNLPDSFDKWLTGATNQMAELTAQGIIAEKRIIHPQEFAAWCRDAGLDCNLTTLASYSVALGREHGD